MSTANLNAQDDFEDFEQLEGLLLSEERLGQRCTELEAQLAVAGARAEHALSECASAKVGHRTHDNTITIIIIISGAAALVIVFALKRRFRQLSAAD